MNKKQANEEKEFKKSMYHFYDDKRPWICFHCSMNFSDYKGLRHHIMISKARIEEMYRDQIRKAYEGVQSQEILDNVLKTELSDKLRKDEDYQKLIETENRSKRFRPFLCAICGKNFKRKMVLKAHYKRKHGIDYDKEGKNGKGK